MTVTQFHFGEPPPIGQHEWVAQWEGQVHVWKNLRYLCKRCLRGPFTVEQVHRTINAQCYGKPAFGYPDKETLPAYH